MKRWLDEFEVDDALEDKESLARGGEMKEDLEESGKGEKRTKRRAASVADGARMTGEGDCFG